MALPTKQEIVALISAKIAGQGTNVDAGSVLPTILNGIIDLAEAQIEAVNEKFDKQIESVNEKFNGIYDFVTESNLNDQFLLLNIENEQAARENGLFVRSVDPEFNVVYLGVPGNSTAIAIPNIVAGQMRVVENATYGKISLILKPGYLWTRSQSEEYNIGNIAYSDVFMDIIKNMDTLTGRVDKTFDFITESNINNQIICLYIENEQVAKTNGLFVYAVNPEFNVVYLGVPGNSTAIAIPNIVAGELRTVQNETYGKISILLKENYIYARTATEKYNLGDIVFLPVFDDIFNRFQ